MNDGELIDAETEAARGEEAFQKILRWRTGNFEFLPAEPGRARTIFKSYNALLLETAQAFDEASNTDNSASALPGQVATGDDTGLTALAQTDGVEFVLRIAAETKVDSRGLENPDRLAGWTQQSLERFRTLGESLQAGTLEQVTGLGRQRNVALAQKGPAAMCVGWRQAIDAGEIRDRMRKILTLWDS